MKLKNQLVSKELSIKLDKLGVKEDSLYLYKIPNEKCRNGSVTNIVKYPGKSKWFDYYRAYTVAELGEILPYRIKFKNDYYFLNYWKRECGEYTAGYKPGIGYNCLPIQICKTEVNARAKLLVYLLENNII